jgi:segregation and condensation protein A
MPEPIQQTFTIHLPQFEGPFDLLLFFIERDELDIHNIPIASITDEFLSYIRQMEALNIDLASEFILVAATLCRIKAKMLLPRKPVDELGNEIDPRHELVQKLLEYKQYKDILDDLRKLEEDRGYRNARGNATTELTQLANQALADMELEKVTLYKLLVAFERIMRRYDERKARVVHTIMRFDFTVEEQQAFIFSKIGKGKKANFKQLFTGLENRIHAIITFLALLELLNLQQVNITQGLGANNFWISSASVND